MKLLNTITRVSLMMVVANIFASVALASTSTGSRTITTIGCHNVDQTCFVELSGAVVGPALCSSHSVRWNIGKSPNGEAAFSQLTAAYLAGKKVQLQISDQCYSEQTNYPTFVWWYLQ